MSRCYECRGNGDDYYLDGENNWVSACPDCPYVDTDSYSDEDDILDDDDSWEEE